MNWSEKFTNSQYFIIFKRLISYLVFFIYSNIYISLKTIYIFYFTKDIKNKTLV